MMWRESRHYRLVVQAVVGVALLVGPSNARAREIDFGRDVRPILSDKCFKCHGADEAARQGELRLDTQQDAHAARETGAAIVAGHPEQSELIRRIVSTDDAERMPPVDSNKSLTPEQIEILTEWVRRGGVYKDHWAFQPVRKPEPPGVKDESKVRNEIDRFVLARLESQGLAPSAEADRATLIRRLYQDLLGIVPTPEEADRFVSDPSPEAYAQLVDELLAMPQYGERWGRHWLDQARYADSNGFTIDGARIMWPYRDWVIQALNSDMPFDQFTIEQLAGDLLPNPTKAQLVATAFHRNTMINQEGGVKADQYRHEAIIDRVNTTGAVWLGMTVGCAQCHTHKFDPIRHDDYYRMYAFFNGCEDANNVGPTVTAYEGELFGLTSEQRQAIEKLTEARKRAEELEAAAKAENNAYSSMDWKWMAADLKDFSTTGNGTFTRLEDGSLLSDRNATENDTYRVSFSSPVPKVTAVRLRVLPHESLPGKGPGLASNGNFVLTDIELQVNGAAVRFRDAWADHAQQDYPAKAAVDGDSQSGWAINVNSEQAKRSPPPKLNAPHELAATLLQPVDPGKSPITIVLKHGRNANYLVGRFAIDVSGVDVPAATPDQSEELSAIRAQIASLEQIAPGKGQPVTQMVMKEQETPPVTYRLVRGDFLRPDQEAGALTPGVPEAFLGGAPAPEFRNRLDFARWLVSRANPLTARVTVNRVWMHYFGRGLVGTENDFGYQGDPPTHSELLDWLAAELMDNGWSLKKLHKLIVLSRTYRQTSDVREDLQAADPGNLWLGRQSRFRVEAEIVRDLALAASGKLERRIGGPSVHPPQPQGVYNFTQSPKPWPESQGPDRFRRTMYTMMYRSAPYPLLTTFDAPDFSTVCTFRPRSNTPLQSLTLANDPMFFELAQALGRRARNEAGQGATFENVLKRMFRLCLTREPGADELKVLEDYWSHEQQRYAADADAAQTVASLEPEESVTPSEAAAWASVARALLNTDEFVTRN